MNLASPYVVYTCIEERDAASPQSLHDALVADYEANLARERQAAMAPSVALSGLHTMGITLARYEEWASGDRALRDKLRNVSEALVEACELLARRIER